MTLPERSKLAWDRVIRHLDKNADGYLQLGEMETDTEILPSRITRAQDKKAEFDFADENGDGKLDLSDFQRLRYPAIKCKEENIRFALAKMANKMDGDKDGSVSWDEYVGTVARQAFQHRIREDALAKYMKKEHLLFDRHDTNHDGVLSLPERRAGMFPEETGEMLRYEARHLIRVGDKNRDEKLSFEEMLEAGTFFIGGKLADPNHDEL